MVNKNMNSELNQIEYDRIVAETAARDRIEPRAASARYDECADKLVVELRNGVELRIPTRMLQGVAGASAEQIATVEVTPSGYGLHWAALDADLSIPGLAAGIFGSEQWMSELARQMGRSKSARKTSSSRANGAKGGRPRKMAGDKALA